VLIALWRHYSWLVRGPLAVLVGNPVALSPDECSLFIGSNRHTGPYGTQLTVWASRSTHWIGGCAANGSPGLSTDGVVNFTIEPTCTVQFPP
jgi:hypothetical protein